ncbi:MAG: hypothetical protein LBS73_02430, partial [Campylobacteraceae bacterium]|nr:hypothetical protein [Campylobacteraceae bacterium]
MRRLFLSVVLFFGFESSVFADSPLTSTQISSAYKNVPVVSDMLEELTLSNDFMDFLIDPKVPIDVKIAIIHALGWENMEPRSTVETFFKYINADNKYINFDDFIDKASGDLLICMAYLKALDNYFEVDEAIK